MQEKIDSLKYSLKYLIIGTFKRAYFWVPPILLDPFDLYRQFIKSELPVNWQVDIIMPSDFGFALFVFMVVVAAFLTYHEERKKATTLQGRLGPKLAFIYETRPPYEDIKYIGDTDKKQSSTFRIGVKNIGGVFLSQCSVILEALPIPGGGGQLPPKRLKLQSDNPYDVLNIGHKQSFPLAPGQQETVEIFRIDEQKGEISICYAREEYRDGNIHDTLKIQGDTLEFPFNLRAIAEQGDFLINTYYLKIDRSNDIINFGTLPEFAKQHNSQE